MGKFHVLAKVAKPYALRGGEVVTAQPGRVLVIDDADDKSGSIQKGLRNKKLLAVKKSPEPLKEGEKVVKKKAKKATAEDKATRVAALRKKIAKEAPPVKDEPKKETFKPSKPETFVESPKLVESKLDEKDQDKDKSKSKKLKS